MGEMRTQLYKGHAEMKQQTVEAVELAVAELKGEIACIDDDRRQAVSSLSDAMNELTSLRWNYAGGGEWTGGEDPQPGNDLTRWYRDESRYREAYDVGDLSFVGSARRVAAPLQGQLSFKGLTAVEEEEMAETPDLVSSAKKAAHAAAICSLGHGTQHQSLRSTQCFLHSQKAETW